MGQAVRDAGFYRVVYLLRLRPHPTRPAKMSKFTVQSIAELLAI